MRPKLSYANVVSTLCLFLLLGGGAAYARSHLAKNSVGTKQIRKNAVNSAKVKNHSLRAADFKNGQLPAGPKGDQGPPGLRGEAGPRGPAGTARAWALVTSSGKITKGEGVASVHPISTGSYCVFLEGLPPNELAAVASPTAGTSERVYASTYSGGCSVGGEEGVQVSIWNGSDELANLGFSLVIP